MRVSESEVLIPHEPGRGSADPSIPHDPLCLRLTHSEEELTRIDPGCNNAGGVDDDGLFRRDHSLRVDSRRLH